MATFTSNGTPITQPSPQYDLPIVSNNGALKYSANMCNVNEQTASIGYYISSSGVVTADANNWIYQDFIPVKPNTTYTLTMSSSVYYVTISEYSTADDSGFIIRKTGVSGDNTTLTITTESTTNYVRFGTNLDRSAVTLDRVLAINWMLTQTDTPQTYVPYGQIYADGTTETVEVRSQNLLKMPNGTLTQSGITMEVTNGKATFTGSFTSNYFYGKISGASLASTNSANAIQGQTYTSEPVIMKAGQAYKIYASSQPRSFYCTCADGTRDSITTSAQGTDGYLTYTPAKDITALWVQYNSGDGLVSGTQSVYQLIKGSTEIPYEPYFNGGSATAEMLLKVGNYQDIQSVLNGEVTRNIGIKVFDGTENWIKGTSSFYADGVITDFKVETTGNQYPLCTHYATAGTEPASQYANTNSIRLYSGGASLYRINIFAVLNDYADGTAFASFLANQYQAGSPVIVVYPLATPTTETVESQELTIQAGTNIVEITQASIDNLELEVSYKAGVAVTITEIENAQLDNSVEVTING